MREPLLSVMLAVRPTSAYTITIRRSNGGSFGRAESAEPRAGIG